MQKIEGFLNVIIRSFLGIIGIHYLNFFLDVGGILVKVGLNPVTVLTVGILGFPGFFGLYLIEFYRLL